MLPLPFVIAPRQTLQVPAQFDYAFFLWSNGDQAKWPQLSKRQLLYRSRDFIRSRYSRQFPNDLSTAANTVVRFALNAMPVDQCQAHTGIIRRNPSAAGRLAWKKYAMVFKLDDLWRQSGKAVPLFIAIHCEIECLWTRKKRNRAHLIRQRVR